MVDYIIVSFFNQYMKNKKALIKGILELIGLIIMLIWIVVGLIIIAF